MFSVENFLARLESRSLFRRELVLCMCMRMCVKLDLRKSRSNCQEALLHLYSWGSFSRVRGPDSRVRVLGDSSSVPRVPMVMDSEK